MNKPDRLEPDRLAIAASAGDRLPLLAHSFARIMGRQLAEGGAELEHALWNAPAVILAHDTHPVPRFFYGNRAALILFAMSAEKFIGLPSHQSAEPAQREDRAQMFARLEADDRVDDYRGIRIAATGRRFMIEQAVIWNLRDEFGTRHGQAATFARYHDVAD